MKKLYYDVKKCLGCKSCEMACAIAHSISGDLAKAIKEGKISLPRKKILLSKDKNYPIACIHCKDPKCVDACIASALVYDKEKGMVIQDEKKCVGCWMCVMVCPYGAIRPNLRAKVPVRCDLCKDKDKPSCAIACPTHAIIYEEDKSPHPLKTNGLGVKKEGAG